MNLDGIDPAIDLNNSFVLNPSASEFVPKVSPPLLSTEGQTISSIAPLKSVWRHSSRSRPSSPESNNKLIRFIQNVHFPKDFLNKCLKVLPPDVSLADVQYQPENFRERWFNYLEERESGKGVEKEVASAISSLAVCSTKDIYFSETEKSRDDLLRRNEMATVSGPRFISGETTAMQIDIQSQVHAEFQNVSNDNMEHRRLPFIKNDLQAVHCSENSFYKYFP